MMMIQNADDDDMFMMEKMTIYVQCSWNRTMMTRTMMTMMVTNDNDDAGESLAANHPGRAEAHISVPLQVISKFCTSYIYALVIFMSFFPLRWGDPEEEDSCKIATDRKFLGANGQYLFFSVLMIVRLAIFMYSNFRCDI